MDEENELTISLSSFSSNLVTLKKQRYEMERQFTETMAFPAQETKEKVRLSLTAKLVTNPGDLGSVGRDQAGQ
mgnify:CR=1 FL=1